MAMQYVAPIELNKIQWNYEFSVPVFSRVYTFQYTKHTILHIFHMLCDASFTYVTLTIILENYRIIAHLGACPYMRNNAIF